MEARRRRLSASNIGGVWFRHRGSSDPGPLQREVSTTTGVMLTAPFRQPTASYPPQPPEGYSKKESGNYRNSHSFSVYDNRHSFQDHGVYFGDGRRTRTLGKYIVTADSRQHWTEADFLKHYGRAVTNYDYNTEYGTEYKGQLTVQPPSPARHRFPKAYRAADSSRHKLDTTTTDWFTSPDVPYRTPLQVLATSQEPFLKANSWKYSYHGLPNCYPAYEMNAAKYRSWLAVAEQNTATNR